jgi:hypothetical protein
MNNLFRYGFNSIFIELRIWGAYITYHLVAAMIYLCNPSDFDPIATPLIILIPKILYL